MYKKKKIYPPLQKRKQIVTESYGPYLNVVWHNEDERCIQTANSAVLSPPLRDGSVWFVPEQNPPPV